MTKPKDAGAPTPRFPTRIKALNMDYAVEVVPQRDVEDSGRMDGVVGSTDHHRGRILLANDLTYAQMRMTLWHEVMHVAFYQGIPSGWSIESFKDDSAALEEFMVSGMEQGFLWILRNNPVLTAYLTWRGDER